MPKLKDIDIASISALTKFTQSSGAVITIMRGYNWYARFVSERMQEAISGTGETNAIANYQKATGYERKLNSKEW
jgi:hypothetical protein